jgi:hypothetical protein
MINRSIPDRTTSARNSDLEGSEERIFQTIRDAIERTHYGSVEIIIHDSRVVQIERKEKTRFDRPQRW